MSFQLRLSRGGLWWAPWEQGGIRVYVVGSDDAPSPAHLATLNELVARWDETRAAISVFALALAPDARIAFAAPSEWAFAARDCGFDAELRYESLSVTDGDAPDRAAVTFYTGFPDGYANYEVVLEKGAPVAITAFAS